MMMISVAKLCIKVFGKGTRITELINHFTVKGPLSLGPIAPIELSIVDGLGQMGHGDAVATGQVGDGTGHLEDSAVSSGRQRQLFHGHTEQLHAGRVGLGILVNHAFGHLGVAVYMPQSLETLRSEERRVGKECRSRWSPYH